MWNLILTFKINPLSYSGSWQAKKMTLKYDKFNVYQTIYWWAKTKGQSIVIPIAKLLWGCVGCHLSCRPLHLTSTHNLKTNYSRNQVIVTYALVLLRFATRKDFPRFCPSFVFPQWVIFLVWEFFMRVFRHEMPASFCVILINFHRRRVDFESDNFVNFCPTFGWFTE